MSDESQREDVTKLSSVPHSWLGLLAAMIGLSVGAAVAVLLVRQFVSSRPINLLGPTARAQESLEEVLALNHIPDDAIERSAPERREHPTAHWNYYGMRVRLPETISRSGIEEVIQKRLNKLDPKIVISDFLEEGEKVGVSLAYGDHTFADISIDQTAPSDFSGELTPTRNEHVTQEAPEHPSETALPEHQASGVPAHVDLARLEPALAREEIAAPNDVAEVRVGASADGPRLAIIVDDGGYGGEATETILSLSPALTLSILPNTPHGTETAERARKLGFEVMLHMPMENMDPSLYPHEGQLMIAMSETEIANLTRSAIAQIPGAVGVNNHMGSKFTSDPAAMSRFADAIRDTKLFFVDSRTIAESRGLEIAKAFGIPSASRDLFLDNDDDPEVIRQRFEQVIDIANEKGSAIAIIHFRPHSAPVLAEMIPIIEAAGIRIVHASELVE